MTRSLRVNGDRLWSSIMEMARIGATAKGGCNRQALTDEDRVGRELFTHWCQDAGCALSVDQMGNMFARRPGLDDALPTVMAGSHLDTQPTGGKFDGVFGVLAALEVVRTLNDADLVTDSSLTIVNWTNEEGARFSPAMIGSGVWAGEFALEYGHNRADKSGKTLGEELQRIGFAGSRPCRPFPVKAAFEMHIEQGPILENERLQIGVLTGVQGMNWYDVTLTGNPCHAGPTPMEDRQDPFMGLHRILQRVYQVAAERSPWGRATFGDIRAEPGARNTVPQTMVLAVDLRHPDQSVLDEMDVQLRTIVDEEAAQFGLQGGSTRRVEVPCGRIRRKLRRRRPPGCADAWLSAQRNGIWRRSRRGLRLQGGANEHDFCPLRKRNFTQRRGKCPAG